MQLRVALAIAAAIACATSRAHADDAPVQVPDTAPVPPVPATTPDVSPPGMTAAPASEDGVSIDDITGANASTAKTAAQAEPYLGTARIGGYRDSDATSVTRLLATLSKAIDHVTINGSVTVDAVTSASVDVRSSPALSKVDVVTSASGRSSTSGGQMTDTRYQVSGGVNWSDGAGHALGGTASAATETDYASVSGGLNGSYDLDDRQWTLLGGFAITDNWVSSVLDSTLHRKMFATAWSAGVARVLTPSDAIRVRLDGRGNWGDLSSPYRSVRFGDWTPHYTSNQITFTNTIGSADGLPEKLPESRIANALTVEWVHSLASGVAFHPLVRGSHDSWGIDSVAAGADLRVNRPTWRVALGYRYYLQGHADFYASKYMLAPEMYTHYTSDKELGDQRGHQARLDLAKVLLDPEGPGDSRLMLDFQLDYTSYRYPDFILLPSRTSWFGLVGLSLEL